MAPRGRKHTMREVGTTPRTLRLARPAVDLPADRLLMATLTLRIPDRTWTGPFSRSHPEVAIEILGRSEAGKGLMIADHWISGRPAGVWTREIARRPDVVSAESLAEVGDGSLYRVKFRTPPIVELYRRLEIPLPFPIRVRAGYAHWEIVARAPEFAQVLNFGREFDPRIRISWTRTPPLRAHLPLLTKPQKSLLHLAIASGYFAVPRRVSLIELARRAHRSKSSVSESMARIERSLLESALRHPLFESGGPSGSERPASTSP
jgi:predicted DNA binding protein